ncbi:hypothetical protein H6F67_25575 [Microcoleus sp. FACHB-1515]|nr:hypothetical protein [Microcoleus sp. FACHB-1515]
MVGTGGAIVCAHAVLTASILTCLHPTASAMELNRSRWHIEIARCCRPFAVGVATAATLHLDDRQAHYSPAS